MSLNSSIIDHERMKWIEPSELITAGPWDVVIIGSGVGGSVTALAAALQNKKVLVVTKKRPVSGVTLFMTSKMEKN